MLYSHDNKVVPTKIDRKVKLNIDATNIITAHKCSGNRTFQLAARTVMPTAALLMPPLASVQPTSTSTASLDAKTQKQVYHITRMF